MRAVYTFADLQNWRCRAPDGPPIRLGVFGSPIAHSRSPQMQNAALQHCGLEMAYARFEIAPEELEAALRLLPSIGFVGVNLTIPHKIVGATIVDEVQGFAKKLGAINTVCVDGRKLIGLNTDGAGFSHAIRHEFRVNLRDLRVLLFGAGGAGRAIAMQCAVEQCAKLLVVNRTALKAQQLAAELRALGNDAELIEAVPWDHDRLQAQIGDVDLVVNATSLGMRDSDPPLFPTELLRRNLMIYDTVYRADPTALVTAALQAGARAKDGRSMLLYQGALAFEAWFDRPAPIAEMRAALAAP